MPYPRDKVRMAAVPATTPEIEARCDGYQIMVNGRTTQILDCTREELAIEAATTMNRMREMHRLTLRLHRVMRNTFAGAITNDPIGTPLAFNIGDNVEEALVPFKPISSMTRDDLLEVVAHQLDQMESFNYVVERLENECHSYFHGRTPDRSVPASEIEEETEQAVRAP